MSPRVMNRTSEKMDFLTGLLGYVKHWFIQSFVVRRVPQRLLVS